MCTIFIFRGGWSSSTSGLDGVQAQGFTRCQIEHHVWAKFATPILHVNDNFKNIVFYIYIAIDNIFFRIFLKILVIFIFVVIILV